MKFLDKFLKPKYVFADEYFKEVKANMASLTQADLDKALSGLESIINNAKKIGQKELYNDLIDRKGILEKELKVLSNGFYKYISTEIIYTMNDKIKTKPVRFDKLENYGRFIPKEVVSIIEEVKSKELFDCYYVLYTDLSKNSKKEAEKAYEKSKDPILFGCCSENISKNKPMKLFLIADWEDKYCNLTFDKLIQELGNDKENINYNDKNDITIDDFVKSK